MTQTESAVAWLVLSPLAVLTNIIAIVVVCHYRRQFHGTDVGLLSLCVTMTAQALLAVPIPSVLSFLNDDWGSSQLCSFYVWLVLCLRMSDLLVTLIMNIHWMCILRFRSGQEVYRSSSVVKVLVVMAWLAAVVTGIVPVAGPTFYTYYQETVTKTLVDPGFNSTPYYTTKVTGQCHFLPEGLGVSFMLFFIVLTLTVMVLSLVATCDTAIVLHYMRRTAVNKYKASRFYLPPAARGHTPAQPGFNTGGQDNLRSVTGENQGRVHANNGGLTENHRNGSVPGHTSSLHGATLSPHSPLSHHNDVMTPNPHTSLPFSEHETTTLSTPHSTKMTPAHRGLSSETATAFSISEHETISTSTPHPQRSRGAPSSETGTAVVVTPSLQTRVVSSAPPTVHARYNELNLSAELCRVVFVFTLLAALLHHLPFVVLQLVQLAQEGRGQGAERAVVWMTVLHSVLVPHVLWSLSRRYRHALHYTWRLYVRRDQSVREDDPTACTLQSYTRQATAPPAGKLKVMGIHRGHGPVTTTTFQSNDPTDVQPNGSVVTGHTRSPGDPSLHGAWNGDVVVRDMADSSLHPMNGGQDSDPTLPYLNGRRQPTEVITTDLDDGMTVITNLASRQVTYIYDTPPDRSPSEHVPPLATSLETSGGWNNTAAPMDSGDHHSPDHPSNGQVPIDSYRKSDQHADSQGSGSGSSSTVSPSRSSLGTPSRTNTSVQRSSSARKVWKEQMMKKHLPSIFINEAFESDMMEEESGVDAGRLPDVTCVSESAVTAAPNVPPRGRSKTGQFHYYMSSNYHHDCLRSDSLPRPDSESDGGSFQYDDNDIEGILDQDHITPTNTAPPHMSTFLGNAKDTTFQFDKVVDAHIITPPDEGQVTSLSEEHTSSVTQPSNTTLDSDDQDKDSETKRHGNTKLPRRSLVLRQTRRPGLHHQRGLQSDPDPDRDKTGVQDFPNPPEESDLADKSFYPVFQATPGTTDTGDDTEWHQDFSGVRNVAGSEVLEDGMNETIFVHSSQDWVTSAPPTHNDSSLVHDQHEERRKEVNTQSQPEQASGDYIRVTQALQNAGPDHNTGADTIATDNIFFTLHNVTSDATFTDDLSNMHSYDTPPHPEDNLTSFTDTTPTHNTDMTPHTSNTLTLYTDTTPTHNTERLNTQELRVSQSSHLEEIHPALSETAVEGFTPQGQATVLGILLNEESEPTTLHPHTDTTCAPPTTSFSDLQPNTLDEFDHFDNFPSHFALSNHLGDSTNSSPSRTNPFLSDLIGHNGHNFSAGSEQSVAEETTVGDGLQTKKLFQDTDIFSSTEETDWNDQQINTQSASEINIDQPTITRDVSVAGTEELVDRVETSSVSSEPSVTLEPYHADRRPPWMDNDFDDNEPVSPKRKSKNPFRLSFDGEDSDTLCSSGDFGSSFGSNSELRTIFSSMASRGDFGNPFTHDNFNGKLSEDFDPDHVQQTGESGFSPHTPLFDEETERGFEDALALEHVIGGNPYYGHFNRCFESIEEEPEDFTDSLTAPNQGESTEFMTTRVSRRPSPQSSEAERYAFGQTTRPSDESSGVIINPFTPLPSPPLPSPPPLSPPPLSPPPPLPTSLLPPTSDNQVISVYGNEVTDTDTGTASAQSSSHRKTHNHSDTTSRSITVGDSNSNTNAVARVQLTKPIRWPSKDQEHADSHLPDSDTLLLDKGNSPIRTNSHNHGTKINGENTSAHDSESSSKHGKISVPSKPPPIPPRPHRRDRDQPIASSSSITYVDPVFF